MDDVRWLRGRNAAQREIIDGAAFAARVLV